MLAIKEGEKMLVLIISIKLMKSAHVDIIVVAFCVTRRCRTRESHARLNSGCCFSSTRYVGIIMRSVVKKECILHIPVSYYPREGPKYGVKKDGGIHW